MIWITTPTATLFYFNVPALLWAGVKRKMVNFSFSVCEWIVSDCSALLQNIVFCFHDEMKNKQLSSRSLEGAFHCWREVLAVMTDSFSHWYIICEPVSWKIFSHICDWLPAVDQGWIVLQETRQERLKIVSKTILSHIFSTETKNIRRSFFLLLYFKATREQVNNLKHRE